MYAPPKPDYPTLTLESFAEYDGWVLGIPTRYGSMPGQWKVCPALPLIWPSDIDISLKAFWDSTGSLWQSGKLYGKYASIFFSSAGLGGGQETTAFTTVTTLTHHGINFVPFGYGHKNSTGDAFSLMGNLEEAHGGMSKFTFFPSNVGSDWISWIRTGSPWGAGTLSSTDGSRQPSDIEKKLANMQGEHFWKVISKVDFS
jgi:NAD(P)H dehydrogenase (quinone)